MNPSGNSYVYFFLNTSYFAMLRQLKPAKCKSLPLLLVLLLCTCGPALNQLVAQPNFSSTLPILDIFTNGFDIPDEPKIMARLRIIDNGPGQLNQLTDAPNDYDGMVGIELRGSTSQTLFPKKGFALETRDADGNDLEVSLLGFPQEEDWVLHGPYSDKSLIRNALAYELAGKIMDYAPRIRMVELVVNGDYRGVYLFTERIKRDNDRVDISRISADDSSGDDLTGGYILKLDKSTGDEEEEDPILWDSNYPAPTENAQPIRFFYHYPRPDRITSTQRNYIQGWMRNFEDALAGDDFLDPNNGYRQYVDLESFVDFLIINEITRNVDGYRISTFMYKEKDSDGGKLHMGPVWDFNLGFGNANYCAGSSISGWGFNFSTVCPGDFWQPPFWWARLQEDQVFLDLLAERWRTYREGIFSNENLNATIDSLVNEMGDAPQRNFDRWPVIGETIWPNIFVGDTYEAEVDYLKDWLINRVEWMDGAMSELTPVTIVSDEKELRIRPNPTSGYFQLEGEYYERINELNIYSITGKLLRTFRNLPGGAQLNISDFPPGTYLLMARDWRAQILTARVVKE